ncbi:MAG TPA: hypothetical protein VMT27_04610, partial [Actinomycetes bacterium]|nr:hypothetical protein [Actinomycetes bacterium]
GADPTGQHDDVWRLLRHDLQSGIPTRQRQVPFTFVTQAPELPSELPQGLQGSYDDVPEADVQTVLSVPLTLPAPAARPAAKPPARHRRTHSHVRSPERARDRVASGTEPRRSGHPEPQGFHAELRATLRIGLWSAALVIAGLAVILLAVAVLLP